MVRISYGSGGYEANEGETVLDCLGRNGIAVPHSCRSGVCQSCLMHADEGTIPEGAQKDLKPTYKKQNLFLACQCRPEGDMRVSLPDAERFDTPAVISDTCMLNTSVLRVRLVTASPFPCEPGQYLSLIKSDGVARSYSVANDPATDGFVELHVRLIKDGAMSEFLRCAKVGQALVIRGPFGTCFYVRQDGVDHPIVLAGTGTGLAPLYGITHQALKMGHGGPIHLYHGALQESDLYLAAELQTLAARHTNFRYVPCVLNGASGQAYVTGNIETIAMSGLPVNKATTRLFLCGAPEFVNALRRKAFLAGLASKHIFADPFLPAKPLASAA